jgi:integrase
MRAPWHGFQGPLAESLTRFLAYKRALGRRYDTEDRVLRLFDRYLVDAQVSELAAAITPGLLDAFLATRAWRPARSYNHLLGVLRRFFDWLVRDGVITRSPVHATPRRETARRIPYLFDAATARRLLDIAGRLPDNPRAPRRGPTYQMIFALLYGLGLRVGEVARLTHADVDLARNLLVIRGTKFGKSRLVPFGPRLAARLRAYLAPRGPAPEPTAPVFSFTDRGPIHPCTISQTFHHLIPRLGLVLPPGVAPPRVHDLRHAFAVGTLLRWYRAGIDPAARLFHLATFLGHVSPTSTAVYLTITTELLSEANRRFEAFALPTHPEPMS